MFLKGIVIITIIGLCQAAEHAYSSQSIVLHHERKGSNDNKEEYHLPVKVEAQKAVPIVEYVVESSDHEQKAETKHEHYDNKHGFSTQHIVLHHDHKGHDNHGEEHRVPVNVEVEKSIPTVEYVVESSGHEQEEGPKHEYYNNKHGFSTQHIVLHHDHKGHDNHGEEHRVPINVEVVKSIPTVEYVVESSGHEQKEEPKHEYYNNKHGFSTQHIVLHHEHKGNDDHEEEHRVPVGIEIQKSVPIVEYIDESFGHEHKEEYNNKDQDVHKEEYKHKHYDDKHGFSTQHIVLHHDHKGHNEVKEEHHVPVNIEVQQVVPVVEYVAETYGHEQKEYKNEDHHVLNDEQKPEYTQHHDHKHAFSSQHIERHDIPAHPPKGWNDHHGPAKYEFEYKIHDPHTQDNKYQHEARDGHHVKGVYSLHEADGSVRTVHYTADKKAGFQADVRHTTKHVEEHKQHQ